MVNAVENGAFFVNGRLIKAALIVCFSLLTISILISHEAPATGYEASIYSSTPQIFWIAVFVSMALGVFLIYSTFFRVQVTRLFRHVAVLLIFICFISCLSIYIIRNYYLWNINGDTATHVMYIKDIISTGYVNPSLYYPIAHIFQTEIFAVTAIDFNLLLKLTPLIFNGLFAVFMYVLAKYVLKNDQQAIIVAIFACTISNGWYDCFTPNALVNSIFPLVAFIFLKFFFEGHNESGALVLLMATLLPPFHILPSIAFIIIILGITLSSLVIRRQAVIAMLKHRLNGIFMLVILTIWSIGWISNFGIWKWTINLMVNFLSLGYSSNYEIMSGKLSSAQGYGYNVMDHLLKLYGCTILFIIFVIVSLPLLLREVNKTKNNLLYMYLPLLMMVALIGLFTVTGTNFDPNRFIFFIVCIGIIFAGYLLYNVLTCAKKVNNVLIKCSVFILALALTMVIIFNNINALYPSPYLLVSSYQSTKSDISGMQWSLDNYNDKLGITSITLWPYRYVHYFYDIATVKDFNMTSLERPDGLTVPYHFGYDKSDTLSSSFDTDLYLITTAKDLTIYTDIFPGMADLRYNESDFLKIKTDKSLDRIYSNGEFNNWLLKHDR